MIKNTVRRIIKTTQKRWNNLSIVAGLILMFFYSNPVSAGGLQGTTLVTGLKNILTDAQKVLLIFGPIAAIVFCSYFFIRLQGADEMDQKKWMNRIKIAVVGLIGCLVAAGLLGVIGG